MKNQRRAVMREFCEAYETENLGLMARIIGANPDLFSLSEDKNIPLRKIYQNALAELGETGPGIV